MNISSTLKFDNEEQFVEKMAEFCHLSQEHFNDRSQWPDGDFDLAFEPISYIVSCYFAHNTLLGHGGVDWDIVYNELTDSDKEYGEWVYIIRRKLKEFEGFHHE